MLAVSLPEALPAVATRAEPPRTALPIVRREHRRGQTEIGEIFARRPGSTSEQAIPPCGRPLLDRPELRDPAPRVRREHLGRLDSARARSFDEQIGPDSSAIRERATAAIRAAEIDLVGGARHTDVEMVVVRQRVDRLHHRARRLQAKLARCAHFRGVGEQPRSERRIDEDLANFVMWIFEDGAHEGPVPLLVEAHRRVVAALAGAREAEVALRAHGSPSRSTW